MHVIMQGPSVLSTGTRQPNRGGLLTDCKKTGPVRAEFGPRTPPIRVRSANNHKVIPAKAGIHAFPDGYRSPYMDSRLRGNDAQDLSRLFAVNS